jgi:response regulator RpfG family c-di-GMP phosphodiesterase
MDASRPRVLCVDDEPNVLQGFARHLRRQFSVSTAVGGPAGLELLARESPFAVVVSDMRMPGMDGATFLGRVREQAPDTTRVLLTGQADLEAAIAAVNQANIFRFLTKPCAPDVLCTALEAAAEQHRLVTAERVLLEETLRGSIAALTELLALVNPAAFGRATRARRHVSRLADQLGIRERWQVEVGAMLSQLGCVTLPAETAEKLYQGGPLADRERAMAGRLPAIADQLLASIPRLDGVRDIVRHQDARFEGDGAAGGERIPQGARLLKVVLNFDALQAQGLAAGTALDAMRGRTGWYDPAVLEAFAALVGAEGGAQVQEMRLREVRAGMRFAEDVRTRKGVLLIARGQEVTLGLLERIRNFSEHLGVKEPVWMIVGAAEARNG